MTTVPHIDTVVGLDMFAFHRSPGLAECDDCGARVQFGRLYAERALARLEAKGWAFSGHQIGASALCPKCIRRK